MELFISLAKTSVQYDIANVFCKLFVLKRKSKQTAGKKGFNKIIMIIVVRISCSSMLSIFELPKVQHYMNESMALPERNGNKTVCVMYLITLTVEFDEKIVSSSLNFCFSI